MNLNSNPESLTRPDYTRQSVLKRFIHSSDSSYLNVKHVSASSQVFPIDRWWRWDGILGVRSRPFNVWKVWRSHLFHFFLIFHVFYENLIFRMFFWFFEAEKKNQNKEDDDEPIRHILENRAGSYEFISRSCESCGREVTVAAALWWHLACRQ